MFKEENAACLLVACTTCTVFNLILYFCLSYVWVMWCWFGFCGRDYEWCCNNICIWRNESCMFIIVYFSFVFYFILISMVLSLFYCLKQFLTHQTRDLTEAAIGFTQWFPTMTREEINWLLNFCRRSSSFYFLYIRNSSQKICVKLETSTKGEPFQNQICLG